MARPWRAACRSARSADRKDLMRRFRDDRPVDVCFARGTFNSHPYVMVAMGRIPDPAFVGSGVPCRSQMGSMLTAWNARVCAGEVVPNVRAVRAGRWASRLLLCVAGRGKSCVAKDLDGGGGIPAHVELFRPQMAGATGCFPPHISAGRRAGACFPALSWVGKPAVQHRLSFFVLLERAGEHLTRTPPAFSAEVANRFTVAAGQAGVGGGGGKDAGAVGGSPLQVCVRARRGAPG